MSLVFFPSGSANPASSLSALMAYIRCVLDRIVRTPADMANAIQLEVDFASYMFIHSACYEYLNKKASPDLLPNPVASGSDVYQQIDAYFAEIVREIAIDAPEDDSKIIHYIISTFHRFSSSARSVEKLLGYLHRHYIKRAIDRGQGWLRYDFDLESAPRYEDVQNLLFIVDQMMVDEYRSWGYQRDSGVSMEQAEQHAQAASSLDCVVPISSVAHRRFRTEFMDQFLGTENIEPRSKLQDSCLARAVQVNGSKDPNSDQISLLRDLSQILLTIGVRPVHPLSVQVNKMIRSDDRLGKD